MEYYPIFVSLKNKKCLVVGAGKVALRKIQGLYAAHAQVTVVAESVLPEVRQICPKIHIVNRPFVDTDVSRDFTLVIAATNSLVVNKQVFEAANRLGIFCNTVDNKELSTFIHPAIVKRGKIIAALSTSGASPILAQLIKQRVADALGDEYEILSEFLFDMRIPVRDRFTDSTERKQFWERFFVEDVAKIAKQEGRSGLEKRLNDLIASFRHSAS